MKDCIKVENRMRMRKNRRESNLKTAQVTFTFTKCKNTTSIASKWQHIRIANAPIPISSDRYIQRFERASFTFRFLLIAKESRIACHDYFSLRIDTARGGDHDSSHSTDNKTLIPRRTTSCLHHAPSKQITFYSPRISAEYSISNPSRTTPRRSLRDSIIARWVHPGFIRDTRFLIALLNVNDGRWSAE